VGLDGRENDLCQFCEGKGVTEENETVRIVMPAMIEDHEQIEVPLRGLGLHNFYMRLHFRVAAH